MDRALDRRARAVQNPDVVRAVAALLAERWDPAQEYCAPDGATAPEAHARAVLGIVGAGGRGSEVMGYLRRAEEAVFVFPRSSTGERAALAQSVEALVLASPAEPAPPGATDSPYADAP
jgi:phosphoglycerate dehydrogenase-like enzyme